MIKNIIRTIMTIALLTVSSAGFADDYNYMNLQKNDAVATTESIDLSTFTAIKFNNGNLTVLNGSTTVKTYALSTLRKITFGKTSTGIRELDAVQVNAPVEVYTATGVHVKSGDADLSGLPQGIYIVKMGGKSVKVLNK